MSTTELTYQEVAEHSSKKVGFYVFVESVGRLTGEGWEGLSDGMRWDVAGVVDWIGLDRIELGWIKRALMKSPR